MKHHSKTGSIRKIRFGLRAKFSLIIIAAVVFATLMTGLVSFSQYNRKIKEEMTRMGTTILKGTRDDAASYFSGRKMLRRTSRLRLNPLQVRNLTVRTSDAFKNMAEYFSRIVKKEALLDIAYCIDVDWRDTSVDWREKHQAEYIYFSRVSGAALQRGLNDRQLKPSIFSHYMRTLDVSTFLAFAEGRDKKQQDYVIVGLPVYEKIPVNLNGVKPDLYAEYIKHRNSRLTLHGSPVKPSSGSEMVKHKVLEKTFERAFIGRLMENETSFSYLISVDRGNIVTRISSYIAQTLFDAKPGSAEKDKLIHRLSTELAKITVKRRLSLDSIKSSVRQLYGSFPLRPQFKSQSWKYWKQFYTFCRYSKFNITSPIPLNKLALISYRKDLRGIIGVFLLRSRFHGEMTSNTNELINTIVSILIRCAIIAVFFPTFIINTVSRLSEGAGEIGKGNLDTTIDIGGSDELGQLSDIFNRMGRNLKKAQNETIEKKRMETELKTAQHIQTALLPEELPVYENVDLGAYYSAQTESGGDYYDFIELSPTRLGITIADVSGHGVGSGLVMAMARTLLHIHCRETDDPRRVLAEINEYLYMNTASTYFVSMFYGILDTVSRKLTYSSAGHLPAMIARKNRIQELPSGGIALGVVPGPVFETKSERKTTHLEKGDYFVQYTDGIVEAMDAASNEYGFERFREELLIHTGKSAQGMVDGTIKSVSSFTDGTPQNDDITMLALRLL